MTSLSSSFRVVRKCSGHVINLFSTGRLVICFLVKNAILDSKASGAQFQGKHTRCYKMFELIINTKISVTLVAVVHTQYSSHKLAQLTGKFYFCFCSCLSAMESEIVNVGVS